MKWLSDPNIRRDIVKLGVVFGLLVGVFLFFTMAPSLTSPTLISIVVSMLISPIAASLERRGYSRTISILLIFCTLGVGATVATMSAVEGGDIEWSDLKDKGPLYFKETTTRLRAVEAQFQTKYSMLKSVKFTDAFVDWGFQTAKWFLENGPALAGSIVAWMLLVPFITFVMLNDGPALRRQFFSLVPNRFFETTFTVTNDIINAISDYIRAKLVEAFLVGLMVGVGFAIVGAPYAIVMGIIGGVTNILPYVGPVIGAVPGIAIPLLDPTHANLLWPIILVYIVANVVDNIVIFPIVVAKLVNLHPLILIAVVMMGQKYYGLVGMLISIPIAAAFKVILVEIYSSVYEQRGRKPLLPEDIAEMNPLVGSD